MPHSQARIFISVAVSNPGGGLNPLPGAINAAERMDTWARDNGYRSLLIHDKTIPVTTSLLRTFVEREIAEVIREDELQRIVFFFAGHGAVTGIEDQHWILSNWSSDPSEAVKVSALQRMLEFYGPRQVTIIGDACQEYSAKFIDIIGSAILQKRDEERRAFELDRFFPVDAGSPAFMIKAQGNDEAFCLFTKVMLDALEGDAPARFFESIDGVDCITSQSIARFLEQTLPSEAGKYGVRMVPRPRPGFYTDRVYYSAPHPVLTVESGVEAAGDSESGGEWTFELRNRPSWLKLIEDEDLPRSVPRRELISRIAYEDAADVGVPENFEGCGLCIDGSSAKLIGISTGTLSPYNSPSWHVVDLSHHSSSDAIVTLANGSIVYACLIPKFVTAVRVFDNGEVSVIHADHTARRYQFRKSVQLLYRLYAGLISDFDVIDVAAKIRERKHCTITAGVVAAQFYDSLRDVDSLRSMASFYVANGQPIPLDIVLFGGGRLVSREGFLYADIPDVSRRAPRTRVERHRAYTFDPTRGVRNYPVAGRVPWMRQAWGAIDTVECDRRAEEWRALARSILPHLGSGLFTTVRPKGRDALLELAGTTHIRHIG